MSSKSSIVERLMSQSGLSKKQLSLNLMYLVVAAVALVLVGLFAFSDIPTNNYATLSTNLLFIFAAVFAGVAGHLLQGPFAHFSLVLFFAVYNFFVAHYKFFTDATSPTILADMKNSALILFWALSFFVVIYLAFVFVPMFSDVIPTAEDAYKQLKRVSQYAPKQAAPAAPAAPARAWWDPRGYLGYGRKRKTRRARRHRSRKH